MTKGIVDYSSHFGDDTKKLIQAVVSGKLPAAAGLPVHPIVEVKLLAPVTGSDKVICIGMNYVDHCTEQNFPIPTEPIIFNKFASAIVGPTDNIELFPETKELDFEVELAIVIGKEGRRIKAEDAYDHIYGWTVSHDVSARDWQLKKNGGQWLLGKCFDTSCPLGPSIASTDEFKTHPENTGLRCILNGESVQDSSTKNLIFKAGDVISWISTFVTLMPGDLILTGTPPGVGCFRKPEPLWLKDGDVVTCEIDGIGAITNKIVAAKVPMHPRM